MRVTRRESIDRAPSVAIGQEGWAGDRLSSERKVLFVMAAIWRLWLVPPS